MTNDWTKTERRELLRLLRRLLRGPCEMTAGEGATLHLGEDAGTFSAALVARAESRGLIARSGSRVAATDAAAPFLRRAMLPEDGFAGQHRIEVGQSVEYEGRRQPVRRNLAESPLSLLARLKDRSGEDFFPEEARAAGERLLSDFHRAQLRQSVTARWEPRLSSRGKRQAGGQADLADCAIAARERFSRAVEAMGPELSGVAVDVCCFEKGLETVERERQWPARSAKLMLRAALQALARHYAPPVSQPRRSHHWGTDGYRPPLSRL